jgi:OmpA-OmpF porin, OOP family
MMKKINFFYYILFFSICLNYLAQAQDEEVDFIITYKVLSTSAKGNITIEKLRLTREKIKKDDSKQIYVSEYYKQDRDGDGVPDVRDKCVDTSPMIWAYFNSGFDSVQIRTSRQEAIVLSYDDVRDTMRAWVDAVGCLPDDDGDGVLNVSDICPNTPKGKKVDKVGCPEGDTDNDGIPDKNDACPDIPGTVTYKGCPADKDGDGVFDKDDDCPTVPGLVELKGCPEKPNEEDLKIIQAASKVKFEPNSAIIDQANTNVLEDFYNLLVTKFPKGKIVLIGHTDAEGTDEDNQRLSEDRAAAVKQYLVDKGIDPDRIESSGKGESDPIDTNNTTEGKANNRRVEIIVQGGK